MMTIDFQSHAGIHTISTSQRINIPIDQAWSFFSNPANLAKITPKHMGFHITSTPIAHMYPGQIITYKVAALPSILINWVTEITIVKDLAYFVDEQRFGPYSMWHHEHHFEADGNETIMYDKISYKVPLGLIGQLMNNIFIKSQLRKIFEYRFTTVDALFGKNPSL